MKVPIDNARAYLPDRRLVTYYRQLINNDPEELLDIIDPEFSMLSDTENETDTLDNTDQVNTQRSATKDSNIKQNTQNSGKDGQETETAKNSAFAEITEHLLQTEDIDGLICQVMQEIIDRNLIEDTEVQKIIEEQKLQQNTNNNMTTEEAMNETNVIEEQKQNGTADTVQNKPRRRKQILESRAITSEDLVIEEIDTVPKRRRQSTETQERQMDNEVNVYKPTEVQPQVNTVQEQHKQEKRGKVIMSEEEIENQEIAFVHDGETQQIRVERCTGVSPIIRTVKTYGRKLHKTVEHTQEPENTCSQSVVEIDDN